MVWNKAGLWGSIQHALSNTPSSTTVMFSLLENLSVKLSQRLTTVMWSIWKHRNLRVWEDVTETNTMLFLHQLVKTSRHCHFRGDLPLRPHLMVESGSLLWRGDINATLTLRSPPPSTEEVLASVFMTLMVLLFWPKLCHYLVLFKLMCAKLLVCTQLYNG